MNFVFNYNTEGARKDSFFMQSFYKYFDFG